jgi:hypothetical protein
MATFTRLKPQTLRLVPQIPFVLAWLRSRDMHAGDLFLGQAKNVDDSEAQEVYKNMLESLDTYGDLSTAQLRSVAGDSDPAVWARAVHALFMGSEPRIVPAKVATGLFGALKQCRNKTDPEELSSRLSSELDKLRLISLDALGELCALIRDTCQNPRQTANAIGPSIFLSEGYQESDIMAACALMQVMVEYADVIFGKPGSFSRFEPLGMRPRGYLEGGMDDAGSTRSGATGRSNKTSAPPGQQVQQQKREVANALLSSGFM